MAQELFQQWLQQSGQDPRQQEIQRRQKAYSYGLSALDREAQQLSGEVAQMGGRQAVEPSTNLFMETLNELRRPQSAMWAAARSLLLKPGDIMSAASDAVDEMNVFKWGWGRLPRDVYGSDIANLLRHGPEGAEDASEDWTTWTVGLAADLTLDPLIFATKFGVGAKGLEWLGKGIRGGMDLLQAGKQVHGPGEGIARAVGRGADWVENLYRTTIGGPRIDTAAGEAAVALKKGVEHRISRVTREEAHALSDNAHAFRELADEAGVDQDALLDIVTEHVEMTKLGTEDLFVMPQHGAIASRRTVLQAGLDPAKLEQLSLERRIEGEIVKLDEKVRELGISTLPDVEKLVGNVYQAINDRRAVRKAILYGKLGTYNDELIKQLPSNVKDQLVDQILDIKDANLITHAREAASDLKAVAHADTRTQLKLVQRESIERDYIMYSLTGQAKDLLAKSGFFNALKRGFDMSPHHSKELHSALKDLADAKGIGLHGLNDLAAKASPSNPFHLTLGDKVVEITEPFQLLDENPMIQMAVRTMYAERKIETHRVLGQFVYNTGRKLTQIEAKMDPMQLHEHLETAGGGIHKGFVKLNIDGYKDYLVPEEAAKILESWWEKSNSPDAIGEVVKAIHGANRIWKAWTLFPFAEYHFRNAVGNQWQKYLAGMNAAEIPAYEALAGRMMAETMPARARKDAGEVLAGIGRGFGAGAQKIIQRATGVTKMDNGFITLGGKRYEVFELMDTLADMGVIGTGQFGVGEFATNMKAAAEQGGRRFFKDIIKSGRRAKLVKDALFTVEGNWVVRNGMHIASAIEDNARLSLALWELDRGKTFEEAAGSVFKHLFDYDDLTDFEKKFVRGVVAPFYSWTRKNIPLQMEYLIKEPHKFAHLARAKNYMESSARSGDAPPDYILSEYVREGFGVRTRQLDNGEWEYFLLNNWIPAADLTNWDDARLSEVLQSTGEMLSPLWKVGLEQFAGKNMSFDRDFLPGRKKFMGQYELFGIDMTDRNIALLRNIRILTFIDRFFREDRPGLSKIALRAITGINFIRQNEERGTRFFKAKQQDAVEATKAAIRRSAVEGDTEGYDQLIGQLERIINGDLDAIEGRY